jgi:hypothetical protein
MTAHQVRRLAILCIAALLWVLLFFALRVNAQGGKAAPGRQAVIDQIAPFPSSRPNDAPEQIDRANRATSDIDQLPPDARVGDDSDNPEEQVGLSDSSDQKDALYAQVAEVWHVLRMRGQQPTPELIAREIGPERLSAFLNIFPGATGMFGIDSDTLPIARPEDRSPAHGRHTAPTLPPPAGG